MGIPPLWGCVLDSVLYNLNIERAVLSAILFDQRILAEVAGRIKSEDFYLPFHQNLFDTFKHLNQKNLPIDEEFSRIAMTKREQWDEAKMLDVLAANPISNISAYADEIINRSQKRKLNMLSIELRKMINDEGKSPDEIIAFHRERMDIIAKNGTIRLRKTKMRDVVAEKPEFWCTNWLPIPVGVATMISGTGGTGKGWLALQLAIRLAREGKRSYLWFSEDIVGLVKERYEIIKREILVGNWDEADDLVEITDEPPFFMLDTDRYGNAKISDRFYGVQRELDEYDMILFDPLLAFYGGDENNNSQARIFMQPFMNWVMGKKKSIIFLHHSKKEGGFRGAGAFMDAMRSGYEIETHTITKDGKEIPDPKRSHLKQIRLVKDNYGASLHTKHLVDKFITPKKGGASSDGYEIVYEDDSVPRDLLSPLEQIKVELPTIL